MFTKISSALIAFVLAVVVIQASPVVDSARGENPGKCELLGICDKK